MFPRMFKRSSKVHVTNCPQNNDESDETAKPDSYQIRPNSEIFATNENRSIENADQLANSTASVGVRVSSFLSGFIGKMGKNRRKNKTQQQLQKSHLKNVYSHEDKPHGQNPRQPSAKVYFNDPLNKTELANENNKIACAVEDSGNYERVLQDSKNSCITHQNRPLHTETHQPIENERVVYGESTQHEYSNGDCIEETIERKQHAGAVSASSIEQKIKNSVFGEETANLDSYAEIDFPCETELSKTKNKPENNAHSPSRGEVNNDEVEMVTENISDIQSIRKISESSTLLAADHQLAPKTTDILYKNIQNTRKNEQTISTSKKCPLTCNRDNMGQQQSASVTKNSPKTDSNKPASFFSHTAAEQAPAQSLHDKNKTKNSYELNKILGNNASSKQTSSLRASALQSEVENSSASETANEIKDKLNVKAAQKNDRVNVEIWNCAKNEQSGGAKIIDCDGVTGNECVTSDFKLSQHSERQMEQNIIYRVDSYNSDDALEFSDIEETVYDQHGKVIEVKTVFKQRSSLKGSQNGVQKPKNDGESEKTRTINQRRRSNSITGSQGIEIVEVGLSLNQHEYLVQQPLVSCNDETDAIKLSDLHDNAKRVDDESISAIDIVEIVEESDSGSEYEEVDEEAEEEETEEEMEEVDSDDEELVSADDTFNSVSTAEVKTNNSTENAFKSNGSGEKVERMFDLMHDTSVQNKQYMYSNRSNTDPVMIAANTAKQNSNTETSINIDNDHKIAISADNAHQKRLQNYSDEAMHLPDIVVGSTLLGSNSSGGRKPFVHSPPKIVVNDNTLDSCSSNDEETETTNSIDDIESDNELQDISKDEDMWKAQSDKLLYPGSKIEPIQSTQDEMKQRELNLLTQISEAKGQLSDSHSKISELTTKISDLERDVTVKSWNVERLQAEMEANYKELQVVKMKLKNQEAELDKLRSQQSEKEEDFNIRHNDLEADHIELKQKLDQMQSLAISLQMQLSKSQTDLSESCAAKEHLIKERNIEQQALQDALDAAIIERAENDAKWQRDFEQLRTLNSDREELLLQDCEWKIRATERSCKDRVKGAEQAKQEALEKLEKISIESQEQIDKVKHLKVCEAEVAALRGLTNEQRQSIAYLTQQLEEMKCRLDDSTSQLEEATANLRKMALKFASELSDKDREMISRIEEARGEVASMWEDRLLNEMVRLKVELETCYAEDRVEVIQETQKEHMEHVSQLKESFAFREKVLQDEVEAIKVKLADRNRRLDEANEKADKQIVQIRMILNKSEQDHQREIHLQSTHSEREIDEIKSNFAAKEAQMKAEFEAKLEEMKRKSSDELNSTRNDMKSKLKRDYESQYEKFKADKEEEQIDLQRNYKRKLSDADVKLRDIEILHQREIKDLQNAHSMERSSLEQRDLQNSHEIETLHRKCRCLTQLFDEMRIRYERREPRAEDVREIQELKLIIEAQDKDLRLLTEKLRELQMHQNGSGIHEEPEPMLQQIPPHHARKMKKPAINCDVIYEDENEQDEEES